MARTSSDRSGPVRLRPAAKPVISSSMPSAAKAGANAVSGSAAAPAALRAAWASKRWIAVSCALRRAQNASGDAREEGRACHVRVSLAQRANQRGDAFSVAADEVRVGRGAAEDVRLVGRADDLRRLLGNMPRGPAVHVCLVPDHVAHAPPWTRRNPRGEAGGLRGVREQPAISFHRRDVLSDLHLISLREIRRHDDAFPAGSRPGTMRSSGEASLWLRSWVATAVACLFGPRLRGSAGWVLAETERTGGARSKARRGEVGHWPRLAPRCGLSAGCGQG